MKDQRIKTLSVLAMYETADLLSACSEEEVQEIFNKAGHEGEILKAIRCFVEKKEGGKGD